MPKYELVSPDALATQADINKLNDSTPSPGDIMALQTSLGSMRADVVALSANLEHRVNRSARGVLIGLLLCTLLLLAPLAAIVYKLYPF